MRSEAWNRFGRAALALMTTLSVGAFTGCAKLGEKEALEKLLQIRMGADGCLNEMGPRAREYLEGTVDPEKWGALFECADSSIVMFQKFVRGSVENGYSPKDIQSLASLLLITHKPVTDALVRSGFELKASILGGDSAVMTEQDLEDVRALLKVAKEESLALLPHLKARKLTPTPEALDQLADAVERSAATLGAQLAGSGESRSRAILMWSTLETLKQEIEPILGFALPSQLVDWGKAAKEILLGGSLEGLEPSVWSSGLRLGGRVVGPLAALASADFEALHRKWQAIPFAGRQGEKLLGILSDTLDIHGGALPLSQVDRVLDLMPDEFLTTPKGKLMDRGVIQRSLRPIVQKIFLARDLQSWDREAQGTLESLLREWFEGQKLLERLYSQLADEGAQELGVDLSTLKRAATELVAGADPLDQRRMQRLIWIAERYRPLYVGSDTQLSFGKWSRYSLTQLSNFHIFRTLADVLLDRYSTLEGKQLATVENFKALFDDVLPLLGEMQLIDPKIPDLPLRRYIEANLFMFLSEGDEGISADEATYYISFLSSIGNGSKRYIDVVNRECSSLGIDPYGQAYVDPKCFRSIYFDRAREWWDHFPETVKYYESLTPKAKRGLQIAMERGARVKGYGDQPIGTYDMQGFTGVLHYLEAVFARYDMNGDQHLNLEETLRAFPAFKGELARFGGIDPSNTALLEAAFTYTVRFGAPPVMDVFGTTHFLMWWGWKPFWTIQADRMAIYKVIGVLSQPPQ
jgi:hypothetical protein